MRLVTVVSPVEARAIAARVWAATWKRTESLTGASAHGLVQVYASGGQPIAVLTQAKEAVGGLLQISNSAGPVANLTIGESGGGYLQLTSSAGQPTVESGTLANGRGFVRAGPTYKCGGNAGMGLVPAAAGVPPDCIVGLTK